MSLSVLEQAALEFLYRCILVSTEYIGRESVESSLGSCCCVGVCLEKSIESQPDIMET